MSTTPSLWLSEKQTSTAGTVNNRESQVTALKDGGYFITWGHDNSNSVLGQRYDYLGKAFPGGPITIATGEYPAITTLTDGSIAIAYIDANDDVVVQRSNKAITAFTTVPINGVAFPDARSGAAITALPNGGYAVAFNYIFNERDVGLVFVDATNALSSPIVVSADTDDQDQPEIATLSNGTVVVAWDDEGGAVQFRMFNSNRQPLTANPVDAPSGYFPDVAALETGGFLLAFTKPAGSNPDIGGRAYSNAGGQFDTGPSNGFTVNTTTTGFQSESAVVALGDGTFVVTWQDSVQPRAFRGQRLDLDGNPVGEEFVLTGAGGADRTDMVELADGRFVFARDTQSVVFNSIWDPRGGTITGSGNITSRPEGATVTGSGAADTLWGLRGVDRLFGAGGKDKLYGGIGNDKLDGGAGLDTHTGGAGIDIFIFSNRTHSPNNAQRDTIIDFDKGGTGDRIDVSKLFGATMTYIHNAAFTKLGQVRVNDVAGPDVLVEANVAGSLAADFSVKLKATTLGSMNQGDFIL